MELGDLLIRIVFLVIPGIASSLLYRKLRGNPTRKDWEDYLEISVFALFSYILAGMLVKSWHWLNGVSAPHFKAIRVLFDKNLPIDGSVVSEIVLATFISTIVALLACYIDEYKVINRVGRKLRATKRFGDEDVWDFIHHSRPTVNWMLVRDHKLDLCYLKSGHILQNVA